MELIRITEDVLINPERISVVEMRTRRDKKELVVHVDNRTYHVTIPPEELLRQIKAAGIDAYDQFFRG